MKTHFLDFISLYSGVFLFVTTECLAFTELTISCEFYFLER